MSMRKVHIVTIVVLIVCALGVLYVMYHVKSVPVPTHTSTNVVENIKKGREAPKGMRVYENAEYHISLFYPEGLSINERAEGGHATTITFQNTKTVQGFQIFVTPYSEPQVTDERFKQDEPSGVRESTQHIVVDGATGAAFYSMNADLGATREVWFVKGGLLYEVTTLKPLEAQLLTVLESWKFL